MNKSLTLVAFLAACSSQGPNNTVPPADTGSDVPRPLDTVPGTDTGAEVVAPTDTGTGTDGGTDGGLQDTAPDDRLSDLGVLDAGDSAAPTDASMDSGPLSGPSAQIRAVQTAAAGAVNLTVSGVLVTYTVPGFAGTDGGVSGNDPAGFFVQAEGTGPALFVAIDPMTLSPRPSPGDRVSFHVTMTRSVNAAASRWVSALDMFARSEEGVSLTALVQDLSSASDVVSGLNGYEHELVRLTGTLSGAAGAAGSSFMSFPISTAGYPSGDTGLRLRMPAAVLSAVGARAGCAFEIRQVPLWRFNAGAQPSAWRAEDITVSMCPVAMDGGLDAVGGDVAAGDTGADVRSDVVIAADVPSCARVVINEFAVAGPMGASDEFVELFNAGTCMVSLEGWTLRYSSSSGSSPNSLWTGAAGLSIAAGGYVVLAGMTGSSYNTVRTSPFNTGLAAGGGAIGIFAPGATSPLDAVAYGTATMTNPLIEGTMPTGAPTATQSASRIPNGTDTNVNSADFRVGTTVTAGMANR